MNSSNKLFVFSILLIPTLLISVNYDSIHNFYTYSMPLNKATIIPNFELTSNEFQSVRNEKDSTCFTTKFMNTFCYKKPRIFDAQNRDRLYSFIVGDNGINGEIHFDRVGLGEGIFTIKDMVLVDEDSALFTFADKDYRIGNEDRTKYEITEDFEFTTVVEKYDSFITNCSDFDGSAANIVQYLGIATIDNVDYFLTWHALIVPEDRFQCKYPEIIQYSLKHSFREL